MTMVTGSIIATPFLGLRYFDEEHAYLFFGRDLQINDIMEKLRRSRLVTVMGSSGSGKSSLVRAGVIPRLKAGLLAEAGQRWRIAKMRPGSSPIASVARELEKALSVPGVDVTLRRGPLGLVQAIDECRLPPGENVLVIADQFEEIFRYQREASHPEKAKEEAAAFVKLLLEATSQRALPIYVVVTMRSDYLGNCAQFRDLPERINDGLYLVPRMRRDQLEQAIAGPVAVEDAEIAPRLLQKLLNETGDDPDQLPVLQHALLRTWNAWNHAARPLDLEDLDAVGGMRDGLSRHADEIYDRLSEDQRRIARVIFQQLSERDAEGREIRRPAPIAQVAAVAGATENAAAEVVERFAVPEAALLYRNEDGHLDITHESLIRKWSRMQGTKQPDAAVKGWLQEEADARDQYLLLVDRAAKNDTLQGRALEDAIAWRQLDLNAAWARRYAMERGVNPFDDVLRFVEECRARNLARRRLRGWLAIAALGATVVFLVVITILWQAADRARVAALRDRAEAERQQGVAEGQQREAESQKGAAERAQKSAESNAVEAERQKSAADAATRRTQVALARSSVEEAVRLISGGREYLALAYLARAVRLAPDDVAARSWMSDLIRLTREARLWLPTAVFGQGALKDSVLSPDETRIALVSTNVVQLWDTRTAEPVGASLPHTRRDADVEFSGDGRRFVTLAETAVLWNAATGQRVRALPHAARYRRAPFSPDGSRLATLPSDATVQVWDASSGQPIGAALPNEPEVDVEFSPDGRRLVTFASGRPRMWDAVSGKGLVGPLIHDDGLVYSATFSPDSRRLVTVTTTNSSVKLWDATSGELVGTPLTNLQASGLSVEFSPDGGRFLTVTSETVNLWDATNGQRVSALEPDAKSIKAALFSSDGQRLVIVADERARLWNASTGAPIGAPLTHQGPDLGAQFSPDGRRLVTRTKDSLQLWDGISAQPVVTPASKTASLGPLVFSPDSRRLLTAASDVATVWDTTTGRTVGKPLALAGRLESARFSPNGRYVITLSAESDAARVWEVDTGEPVGEPLRHLAPVNWVAFTPDGRRIISGSGGTIWLWHHPDTVLAPARVEHDGPIESAAFSPDGRRAVTASFDSTARIWDVATLKPVVAPLRQGAAVLSAAFSSDGRFVVTAAGEGTAQVWNALTGERVGAAMRHKGAVRLAIFNTVGPRRVVTASDDDTAQVWDATTGSAVGARLQHKSDVSSAMFSLDGSRVVTASDDRTAGVWDAATGRALVRPLQHDGPVTAAVFSADSRLVATASGDTVRLWDTLTGQSTGTAFQHRGRVRSVNFSSDLRHIVTASDDTTARVWDVASGQPVGAVLEHQGEVRSAAFSADGRRIITVSNAVRVWDVSTGMPVSGWLAPGVHSAAFSVDGRRIVSTEDNEAEIWDVLYGSDSTEDAELFADLAEILGGYRVNESGSVLPLEGPERRQRIRRIAGPEANASVQLDVLLRLVVPAATR